MDKLKIYHFHNGSGGGVLSVIKNLLRFSTNSNIENHIIHAVNKKELPNFKIEPVEGAVTQQLYFYTPKNNFYYTCKELSKLLPSEKAIIVAHDWVELGMASNLGLPNPVVHYLHGDYNYYYQLSLKNKGSIDLFIAVTKNIQLTLQDKIKERANDILYVRFPVPDALPSKNKSKIERNIIFIGRLVTEKGYYLLPAIAKKINTDTIKFKWHIVGSAPKNKEISSIWNKDISVQFYGAIENNEVQMLLSKMDFFILPSFAEGMPVSLIEAMKAGVVPFVNDLNGGISELIENGITGYKIIDNKIEDYAIKLIWISKNDWVHKNLLLATKSKADRLFGPYKNVVEFENLMLTLTKKQVNIPIKIYGSRLDQQWIPNFLVRFLRTF